MAVNSIYKVALVGKDMRQVTLVNTLYFQAQEGTILDTQAQDLAQAVEADLLPLFKDTFNGQCAIFKVEVRGVTDPQEGYDLQLSPEEYGTRGGDQLPATVTAVVTFLTGLIGRRNRGRNYLWPAGEGDNVGGAVQATYVTAIGAYADGIRRIGDGVVTSIYDHVVYSRTGSTFHKVTDKVVRPFFHVQRRRSVGVGA